MGWGSEALCAGLSWWDRVDAQVWSQSWDRLLTRGFQGALHRKYSSRVAGDEAGMSQEVPQCSALGVLASCLELK